MHTCKMRISLVAVVASFLATSTLPVAAFPILGPLAAALLLKKGNTPCDQGIPDSSCAPGQVPGSPAPSQISVSFGTVAPQPLSEARTVAVWPQDEGEKIFAQRIAQGAIVYGPDQIVPILESVRINPRQVTDEQRLVGLNAICDKTRVERVYGGRNSKKESSTIFSVELFAYSCQEKSFTWLDKELLVAPGGPSPALESVAAVAWANRVLLALDMGSR